MNATDLFGIIVRVIGLGCVGYSFRYVMSWLYVAVRNNAPQDWAAADYLLAGVIYLVVGLFFLRRSHLVVGFAYPRGRDEKTDTKNEGHVV